MIVVVKMPEETTTVLLCLLGSYPRLQSLLQLAGCNCLPRLLEHMIYVRIFAGRKRYQRLALGLPFDRTWALSYGCCSKATVTAIIEPQSLLSSHRYYLRISIESGGTSG